MVAVAERLQVREVGLIITFAYTHMDRRHLEARLVYLRPLAKEFDQGQGVLAATETDEYMVAVGYQLIVGTGFMEAAGYVIDDWTIDDWTIGHLCFWRCRMTR